MSTSLRKPDCKLFRPYCLFVASLIFRFIRVNGKPEKSEHKLLQPTSPLSHEQPSHRRRTPQPLTLVQPFPSHPSEQIYALLKKRKEIIRPLCLSPLSTFQPRVFCSCDQSRRWPWKEVHEDKGRFLFISSTSLTLEKKFDALQRWFRYLTLWLMFSHTQKKKCLSALRTFH